jgi:ATP-GRASP peptide maturase of grasp-with-spasm system
MVLILSEQHEQTTNVVIEWLIHYLQKIIRLNREDFELLGLKLSTDYQYLIFKFKDSIFDLSEFKAVWYRRGNLDYLAEFDLDTLNDKHLSAEITKHITNEWKNLMDYFHYLSYQKKSLGNFFKSNISKLISLDIAKRCGLDIPETLITINSTDIQKFKDRHTQIISKGIQESASFTTEYNFYQNYTEEVTDDSLQSPDVTFFPTLFQNKLDKLYELRIFYMKGDFYTMAIFSQSDTQTQTDFRKYNDQNPNRTVPYQLPIKVSDKLHRFMIEAELDTGSIDMVVTKDKRYVFLEVNPVGQFGMVSYPCNYYLEKRVADYLST